MPATKPTTPEMPVTESTYSSRLEQISPAGDGVKPEAATHAKPIKPETMRAIAPEEEYRFWEDQYASSGDTGGGDSE